MNTSLKTCSNCMYYTPVDKEAVVDRNPIKIEIIGTRNFGRCTEVIKSAVMLSYDDMDKMTNSVLCYDGSDYLEDGFVTKDFSCNTHKYISERKYNGN